MPALHAPSILQERKSPRPSPGGLGVPGPGWSRLLSSTHTAAALAPGTSLLLALTAVELLCLRLPGAPGAGGVGSQHAVAWDAEGDLSGCTSRSLVSPSALQQWGRA